jgi:Tfp pilus assembly protein PilF
MNSRSVHLLLLGMILGAATAYVYASVQTSAQRAQLAGEARDRLISGTAADPHAGLSDADMLEMFEQALATSPDDPELLSRYATFLFDLRRFAEAADAFERALVSTPRDAEIRTYMATALYAAGERERAMREFETALEDDPNQILALHNVALGYLDLDGDPDRAAEVLSRIEAIDPAYEGLASLRQRIEAARQD